MLIFSMWFTYMIYVYCSLTLYWVPTSSDWLIALCFTAYPQYSSHVTYFNEIVLLLGDDADDGQIILPLHMDSGTRVGLRAAFKVNVSVDGELRGGSILMQGGGFEVTR